MPQGRKGPVNYRCPVCFAREIDMDMLYDAEKDEYYCIRCPYAGKEDEILAMYEQTKLKYKDMKRRFTTADFYSA